MLTHSEALAALSAANVVHVYAAARAAGLSFRNGPSKQDVINLLSRNAAMTQAAYSYLLKNHGDPLANAPQEQPAPQPAASEASVPLASQASVPVTSSLDPAQQMAAAIRALASGAIDESRVRAIMREELEGFEVSADSLAELVRSEVAKLPQGTVINLPEKSEPVKFDGVQHRQFGDLLLALRAELNVILCGPASSGKTYAAEQAAKALGLNFHAQGAVSYAHELLGYVDAHGKYVSTEFRKAFEHGGLILLDEFDASSAEAPLVVNAALANGFCAFPDGMVKKHAAFLCVAGTNTDGSGATMQYAGRARLDGAFLDRFVKIDWAIDPNIEKGKAAQYSAWLTAVREVREFVASRQIHDVAATVRAVDFGARLLAQKMAPNKVAEFTLKRGALANEWEAIKALPAMREFLSGF